MDDANILRAFLISAGWAILIWNSNRIAKRGDIRSSCNRAIDLLINAKEAVHEFWLEDESDELISESKVSSFLSMLELINNKSKDHFKRSIISTDTVEKLRNQLTEGFEAADRSQGVARRLSHADDLIFLAVDEIESSYHQIYEDNAFWRGLLRYYVFWGLVAGAVAIYVAVQLGSVLSQTIIT